MKKINLEKLLCIFIILLPILDLTSFIFRNNLNVNFSPSTFIRPIIPITCILILFFKNKFKIKLIVLGVIYILYAIIHLYCFNKLNYQISFGTTTHELQYIVNYTFSIINLLIFMYVFHKKQSEQISKCVLISNGIYILSIYISIVTNTSSTTYLEGMGNKGWFESGNSLSAILVLNLFIIFTIVNKDERKLNKIIATIEIILCAIFLIFLIGTRTGVFGLVIAVGVFCLSKILIIFRNNLISKDKRLSKNNKILLIVFSCLIILVITLVLYKGSSLLERQQYLQNIDTSTYDDTTGNQLHVTTGILRLKQQIENSEIDKEYMSEEMQTSILQLYDFANEHNISATDRRPQQLAYNYYLVKNQSNILYILFGNGFLNNYGELILEMEIPAFLFNFGVLGFIIFFGPFLGLFIYYMFIGVKNIKSIDSEYILLICGDFLSFALSFLLGQIFFHSSAMIIIVCINVLLYNKCVKIKENTIINSETEIKQEPVLIK